MAYERPTLNMSYVANQDLSSNRYELVKLSANGEIELCNAVADKPLGVLQNNPEAGDTAVVMLSGVSKVKVNEALAAGDSYGTAANGKAEQKTEGVETLEYVLGQVIEGASAADELAVCTVDQAGRAN